MPGRDNIEQYTNPVDGLKPDDRGSQAFVMEGRRVGEFARQMGQDFGGDIKTLGDAYVEHQTQQELSVGIKSLTDMEVGFETDRANFFAQNQGPDAAAKWQQHVQDITTKWQSQFQTEKGKLWAAEAGGRLYGDMTMKGYGDQADMDEARNAGNWEGALSNRIYLAGQHPESAQAQIDAIEKDSELFRPPTMDYGKWELHRQEVVHTAQVQAADNYFTMNIVRAKEEAEQLGKTGPIYDQVEKDIAGGRFHDLLGSDYTKISSALDEAKKSGIATFEGNQEHARRDAIYAGDTEFAGLYPQVNKDFYSPQGLSPDDQKAIDAYEKAHPDNLEQIMALERMRVNNVKAQIHSTFAHSDGDTLTDAWQRVGLPDSDPKQLKPTEITDLQHQGKLSPTDANLLLREAHEGRTATSRDPNLGMYRGQLMRWMAVTFRSDLVKSGAGLGADPSGLGGTGGGADPAGSMAYGEAVRSALATYQYYVGQKKMTPAEAFEKMTTPGSNNSFANSLHYYEAARDSQQPEDFFSLNPSQDHWIDAHGGWRAQLGSGTPSAAAPQATPQANAPQARLPGENWQQWKTRTGG